MTQPLPASAISVSYGVFFYSVFSVENILFFPVFYIFEKSVEKSREK
jgi:hypothetical protein